MANMTANGQYGKRNPLFMYQGTAGHSIRAALKADAEQEPEALITRAEPSQSGMSRCGMLQNDRKE